MDSTPVGAVDASGTVLGTVRGELRDIAGYRRVSVGSERGPERSVGILDAADHIRNASNAAADRVTAVATVLASAPSSASGMSSAMVIHTMHPAAESHGEREQPGGMSRQNAGTASRGCGRR